MVNGEHEKFDFDYVFDDEVFSKLFYLVDSTHPSLSRFTTSDSNPHTNMLIVLPLTNKLVGGY